jgi:glucose 1-dehydrogenase
MLTHTMALELAPYKINANCIAPGAIDTPMLRQAAPDEAAQQQFLQLIPWGRLGQPADIANAALFLASEEADYITGETLFVDGGWLTK